MLAGAFAGIAVCEKMKVTEMKMEVLMSVAGTHRHVPSGFDEGEEMRDLRYKTAY